MIKIIYKLFRNIVIAFGIIYSLNLILVNMGISIPINVITLITIALLGFPGVFSIIGLLLLV